MRNFDEFIGIDWSGAKLPVHTKSISVARCARGFEAPILIEPPVKSTYWSRRQIFMYIADKMDTHRRVFIGIDANFGYAYEVGEKQLGERYNAYELWAHVDKICKTQDNYFASEYWEHYPQYFWGSGKKPEHITLPKRETEIACVKAGYGRPESPFKLIGAKQVGKGGLAAMRMAHHLKQSFGNKICIWPFEKQIEDTAQIVISEIYPRQFLKRCGHGNVKIRNVKDLNKALGYFDSKSLNVTGIISDHDSDALISAAGLRWLCGDTATISSVLCRPSLPGRKSSKAEGWIFGVDVE